MMNRNSIAGVIVFLFLVVWVIWGIYRKNQFESDYKIVIGQVIGITTPGWKSSGDYSILYEYFIDGDKYSDNNNYKLCGTLSLDKLRLLLINKSFPVAYSVKHRDQSILIINEKQAAKFDYKPFDSLRKYDSILTCK